MAQLSNAAKEARIEKYRPKIHQELSGRIIDCNHPAFWHLINEKGQKMESLDGGILLETVLAQDGSLKGVVSVDVDDLASILPNIKADTEDKMGWVKHLDNFEAEGVSILQGVDDPTPDEFELTAAEELATLDVPAMSDFEAKQKLIDLQVRLGME